MNMTIFLVYNCPALFTLEESSLLLSFACCFRRLFSLSPNTDNVHFCIAEEMKEDYDTMGPEAAIQTTGNNGTGKDRPLNPLVCRTFINMFFFKKN